VQQVHAQRAFDVQTFVPPAGEAAVLTIPEPELPPHGTLQFGLFASYADSPLVRQVACSQTATTVDSSCVNGAADGRTDLVSDLAQVDAAFAVALYDALELGVVIPVALARTADDLARPQVLSSRVTFGDLRLSVSAPIVKGATALSLGLIVTLPSGDEQSLVGARTWTAMPQLVFRQRFGKTKLAAMLGYRLRERAAVPGFEQHDELDLAIGAALPVWRGVTLRPELRARVGTAGRTLRENENPVEGGLGFSLAPSRSVSLLFGGGAGLWPGRDGYGAPTFRLFALLRYALSPKACAAGSEDAGAEQTADACRDPDSDRDGLADQADTCPNDAEDRDGFADADGCPDADDDADGLGDTEDHCPRASEDVDGWQDDDGCPELDNDDDGISDALDACTMDPEDIDGFEDRDGCPEPGPKPISVSVSEGRILVSERIYFEYDRDTIRNVSAPVLDELATVIRGLEPGTKVIVEGHTDDSGNTDYNLDLSHRRARAVVEYLHARGVPSERLDFIGYGAAQPLGPSDSPEGRELNRRVEFRIER
jgi:outer membrane protein OmpA-like peptidoglycan-associated protein